MAATSILVVDDDADLAALTAEFLSRENDAFTVDTATSGAEGAAMLADTDYDCIVSDYEMPGCNGIEFLQDVRSECEDLPFILYTGKGSEEIASEAMTAGVDDYLQKSHGNEQYTLLANRITNLVEKYRSTQETASTRRFFSKLIQHASDVIPVIDAEGTITYVSPSCELILGYQQDELVGETAWDYLHPDDVDRVTEKFVQTIENPDTMQAVEFRFEHADGSWVRLHGRAKNLLDDPDVEGIVSYNRIVEE